MKNNIWRLMKRDAHEPLPFAMMGMKSVCCVCQRKMDTWVSQRVAGTGMNEPMMSPGAVSWATTSTCLGTPSGRLEEDDIHVHIVPILVEEVLQEYGD